METFTDNLEKVVEELKRQNRNQELTIVELQATIEYYETVTRHLSQAFREGRVTVSVWHRAITLC